MLILDLPLSILGQHDTGTDTEYGYEKEWTLRYFKVTLDLEI